ncbi:MAG: hypothetical protein VYE73_15565 [Acidobacteriota bacterium]|nr:hypothetical protein [Acidobacteriota bacterium]
MKRKTTTLLAGCLIVLSAAAASAQTRVPYNDNPNSFRIRSGEFRPDGNSIYWEQREIDFFGTADDWEDSSWGVDFQHRWSEHLGFRIGFNNWDGGVRTSFRDFVDDDDFEIEHDASLDVDRLDFGIVWYPIRASRRLAPYVGGGFSFAEYALEERGDFIDFGTFDVTEERVFTEDNTMGWFWVAGLEVGLAEHVAAFGEARWYAVDDSLRNGFREFGNLDLGGRDLSAGLAFRW